MRSVKTVPCRTQEWDFCYNPYSVASCSFFELITHDTHTSSRLACDSTHKRRGSLQVFLYDVSVTENCVLVEQWISRSQIYLC